MKGYICMYRKGLLVLLAVVCLTLQLPILKQQHIGLEKIVCSDDYIDIISPNVIIDKIII